MELETIIGRVYSVTSDTGCTVGFKGADGVVHQQKTVSADTETFFVAKSRLTVVSDDKAVVTVLPSGAAIGLSADGGLQFRVVDALPSEGKSGFVYLAPSASSESGDVFEEWLYVDGSWERFGRKIDLSPFATKALLKSEIADHADDMATINAYGHVKKSSDTGTSIPAIGVNDDGQMMLNVRSQYSGFESDGGLHVNTSTDTHPTAGAADVPLVATNTDGKLTGMAATQQQAGGVILATSLDDSRPTAVPTAAMVREGMGSGSSVPTEQLLAPSVGLDSFAAGPGAVAYCADSLAVGIGAVVGATYASQNKTATATRKSTDAESETNATRDTYSSNSVAVGLHAQASGFKSTAYGNFATTSGNYSTAIGSLAKAEGGNTTSIGSNAYTYGVGSTAIGVNLKATNNFATASGYASTASGHSSTASGRSSTASGSYSTASGSYSTASGSYSTTSGVYSTASGVYSTASGSYSTASGYASTASGVYANVGTNGTSSVALGAGAYVNDAGCVAINAGGASGNGGSGYSTQLYLITKGSSLATTYLGGEAGLGYLVIDHVSGSIVARGVIPLASICTEHTSDFEPNGYANIQDY